MVIEQANFNFNPDDTIGADIEANITESSHLLLKTQKQSSETRKSCFLMLGIIILCLCLVGAIIGGQFILRAISKYKYQGLKLDNFKFDI